MKTVNQLLFENLTDNHYTNTAMAVEEYHIFKQNFKTVLGYDEKTDGSVAIQKNHAWAALINELHIAQVLKENGHSVILLSEIGVGKHADATVDGILSEFKQVRKLTIRSLKEDFYEARKKGAKCIVLEIKDTSDREFLFELLKRIANNPMVNELQDVFLVLNDTLERWVLKDLK
jgi:phosphopantetheine adenylyltransferase